MKRSAAVFLIVMLAGVASAGHPGRARAASQPNIVLILTDDQRANTLWAMPNVRRTLLGHGVEFTHAYVVNSLCCPSRTSILTGNYSHTTGVYTNRYPTGGFERFTEQGEDASTIATWLHDAGYETALVGKYLNQYRQWTQGAYIPPGWDRWDALDTDGGGSYYNYAMTLNGRIKDYGHQASDYSTTVLTSYAVHFIEHARTPFFLYFAPSAPHGPAKPPPGDEEKFPRLPPYRPASFNEPDMSDKPAWAAGLPALTDTQIAAIDGFRRRQYQALLGVDRSVARIVGTLWNLHELHDTMIVFMSDNGVQWGEHRLEGKAKPYEESVHVPLVIRYNPFGTSARTEDHLALNIDLAPTFAQLAGVQAPPTEGTSLLPLLENQSASWRSDFLIEHLGDGLVPSNCEVHSDRYVLIRYEYSDGTKEDEMYDLQTDPLELQNVAGDPAYGSEKAILSSRMHALCNPPPPGTNLP